MMLTHCGNNVRNRHSGCVFSVKDIAPVPLKTSRNQRLLLKVLQSKSRRSKYLKSVVFANSLFRCSPFIQIIAKFRRIPGHAIFRSVDDVNHFPCSHVMEAPVFTVTVLFPQVAMKIMHLIAQ